MLQGADHAQAIPVVTASLGLQAQQIRTQYPIEEFRGRQQVVDDAAELFKGGADRDAGEVDLDARAIAVTRAQ